MFKVSIALKLITRTFRFARKAHCTWYLVTGTWYKTKFTIMKSKYYGPCLC